MDFTINENNLQLNEIQEFSSKSRAILLSSDNKILLANYGGIFLLPGGKVDNLESPKEAIIRELKEETGIGYMECELNYMACLKYYQKDYPKRDSSFCNRLLKTYYFTGKLKKINLDSQKLTDKEREGNFHFALFDLEHIEQIVLNNNSNNPRNIYFQKEFLTIFNIYRKLTFN